MKMTRGTFYLMIAEGVFVLSGYAIHIGSKRILGIEWYGVFGFLLTLLIQYRVFLTTGVNRAVSKYTAEEPSRARLVRRQALKLQLILGIALGGAVLLASPVIARIQHIPAGYIRLTALFLPIFGIYSVYRGSLNGLKLFGKEARVSIVYSLLKIIFLFALIYHFQIYGAITGYLAAIIAAAILARFSCPPAEEVPGETFPVIKIVKFALPVVLFSFTISLVQHVDLYFIRGLLPPAEVDRAAGYYICAQQFAKIPYMLLYAFSLTLFPNIASSTSAAGQEHITAATIRISLRWGLLLILPVSCLISAAARPLIAWVYGADSMSGGGALEILIFGQTFLSFLFVLAMILTASGHPWLSFSLVAGTLAVDALLNYQLVPIHNIRGAAAATTIAAALGVIIAGGLVLRHFHVLIERASALKIIIASALLFGATRILKPGGWLIPPAFIVLGGGYILLLRLLRAIDRNDWEMIRSLFRRKSRIVFEEKP